MITAIKCTSTIRKMGILIAIFQLVKFQMMIDHCMLIANKMDESDKIKALI